jgi:hypothetical protein
VPARWTPSRDAVLRCFGAAGLLGASTVPAGAAPGPAADTVMIVRHAEKPHGEEAPYGVTEEGTENRASITVRGWMRAGALADAFAHPGRWGLPVPAAIYASRPGDDTGLRCVETVTPLARRLGVALDTSYARGEEERLAAALRAGSGPRLVAWEHLSIPAIVAHLGAVAPQPAKGWDGDRYDLIWCFVRGADGSWAFRPIAQQLLPGDASSA